MQGHTDFKKLSSFSKQDATTKCKISSSRGVCDATSFLVADFIEHVTELGAHMAAVAA